MYAISAIGELPENSVAAFALMKIMLKANLFWDDTRGGNTIALADDGATLIPEHCYAEESREPFEAFILSFAENCEYMADLYAGMLNEITENIREEQELDETGRVIDIGDDDSPDDSFAADDEDRPNPEMNFYSAISAMIAA